MPSGGQRSETPKRSTTGWSCRRQGVTPTAIPHISKDHDDHDDHDDDDDDDVDDDDDDDNDDDDEEEEEDEEMIMLVIRVAMAMRKHAQP